MAESEARSVECGFCCRRNEDLEQPKTLPCTHVHCLGCLTAFFEINHMTRCPVADCGEVVEVPLDTLPTYKVDSNQGCHVCIDKELGNQPAAMYCITCEKKYCDKHEELHDALLTGHKKINITEYGAQHKRVHTEECAIHTNQPYTLGCKVCLTLFCVSCVSGIGPCGDGSAHKLMSLDELVAALVEDDIKVQMIAKEEKLEKLFKQTSKASSEYDNKTREMIELLRNTRDEQLRVMREKYDRLEEELVEKRQKKRVEVAEYLEDKVLTMWTQLRNQRHNLETKLKHCHQVDMVKGFSELKVKIQKLVDEQLPKLELCDLVKLAKKDESRNTELEIVSAEGINVGSELGVITSVRLPTAIRHLQTVQLPAAPLSICHYKGSIYIGLADNSIVRVDSSSQVVVPFISCSGRVDSVIVYRERVYTLLYRSSINVISIYDMSGSQIRKWSVSCNSGHHCNVLSLVSDQLVLADIPNKRITVYSLSGQVLRHIPCTLLGSGHAFMCAVDDHSVVISDQSSSTVCRVDINTGDVMWSTSIGTARGVYCYGSKYVLVGRCDSKIIQILDCKTGHLLSELTNDAMTGNRVYGLQMFGSTLAVVDYWHRGNSKKVGDVKKKLASQLVEDPELKEFAKACFIAYIKGYFLMKNKCMFDIAKIPADDFAQSLGLVLTPRIRFLQKHEKLQKEREKQQREFAKDWQALADSDTSS